MKLILLKAKRADFRSLCEQLGVTLSKRLKQVAKTYDMRHTESAMDIDEQGETKRLNMQWLCKIVKFQHLDARAGVVLNLNYNEADGSAELRVRYFVDIPPGRLNVYILLPNHHTNEREQTFKDKLQRLARDKWREVINKIANGFVHFIEHHNPYLLSAAMATDVGMHHVNYRISRAVERFCQALVDTASQRYGAEAGAMLTQIKHAPTERGSLAPPTNTVICDADLKANNKIYALIVEVDVQLNLIPQQMQRAEQNIAAASVDCKLRKVDITIKEDTPNNQQVERALSVSLIHEPVRITTTFADINSYTPLLDFVENEIISHLNRLAPYALGIIKQVLQNW